MSIDLIPGLCHNGNTLERGLAESILLEAIPHCGKEIIMKPESFAVLVLSSMFNLPDSKKQELEQIHRKYNSPDIKMRTRPAKASELLALQRRINKPRGHYYLQQERT